MVGLQVFSEVDILFSIGGKYYTGEPITYTYMEDKIFETSRNITIKLHHRVGKFVKLRLHFSDRWIMVSEVTFDSGKAINRITGYFMCSYLVQTIDICLLRNSFLNNVQNNLAKEFFIDRKIYTFLIYIKI